MARRRAWLIQYSGPWIKLACTLDVDASGQDDNVNLENVFVVCNNEGVGVYSPPYWDSHESEFASGDFYSTRKNPVCFQEFPPVFLAFFDGPLFANPVC